MVSSVGDEVANSTLTANRGDHPSSTIAGGGKTTTKSAGNYTTSVDATVITNLTAMGAAGVVRLCVNIESAIVAAF